VTFDLKILEHLAGRKGNVASCATAPVDIKDKMVALLDSKDAKRAATSKRKSDAASETGDIFKEAALDALSKTCHSQVHQAHDPVGDVEIQADADLVEYLINETLRDMITAARQAPGIVLVAND